MRKVEMIEKLKNDPNDRAFVMIALFIAGFLLIFLLNNVTTHFELGTWLYRETRIFPTFPPAGNDFRVGYYRPAFYLIDTRFSAIGPNGTYPSNYPPLVALSSLPYALFDMTTAYAIHVVLLIAANLACLIMALIFVKKIIFLKTGLEEFSVNIISFILFFLVASYIFSSYFFFYSIERGNTDIFALFYCFCSFWVLIKNPNKIWLQVILLSVAVHFKIYPIILFALLFFKHGKKLILPTVIVNVIFLFCLGPNMAWAFLKSMSSGGEGVGIGNAWSNVANHASYSFSIGIDSSSGEYLSNTFFLIWAISFLVPLLIWGITTIAVILSKYDVTKAILIFMSSIPLMGLLPTVSMDYKLVINGAAIILLTGLITKLFITKFAWFDVIQVLLLIGVFLMMSRSYAFIPNTMVFIQNKYIWLLFLEIFMALNIFRYLKRFSANKSESIEIG
ncbi:MAG TPA: hypothetical protein DIW44_04525 [Anaerolineaceae bacterium]|nr:hypothetical protein [Anaerolineaceae bacterium]